MATSSAWRARTCCASCARRRRWGLGCSGAEPAGPGRCRRANTKEQGATRMRRHRSIGLLTGTLLAMALATSVAAKGPGDEVVLTLDKTNDPHAGAPITIGVLMTRAGSGSAIRGETVTFQLARNGGIGLVTVPAKEVTMGHYTATVTIPDEGSWTPIVNATCEGGTQTFHAGALQVGHPVA